MRYLYGVVFLILVILVFSVFIGPEEIYSKPTPYMPPIRVTENQKYVGNVDLDCMSIRVLILKHCPDAIANTDANQALQAVDLAASKGLSIESIGNFHINKDGFSEGVAAGSSVVLGQKIPLDDLNGLKNFISEQMKIGAKPGDTIIVYTIGHGGGDGGLMRLGQREGLMHAIADAAEENDQETFWWQLSCHADAKLPKISTLPERQQELFSMSASSPANEVSYFTTQGKQMKILFTALAEKSTAIDPDQDGVVTVGELKNFMIENFGQKRGSLIYGKSPDEPVFGLLGGLANKIPVIDHNNTQGTYKNYIPVPRKR